MLELKESCPPDPRRSKPILFLRRPFAPRRANALPQGPAIDRYGGEQKKDRCCERVQASSNDELFAEDRLAPPHSPIKLTPQKPCHPHPGATISNVTTTNTQYALAADIGGTNIRAALINSEGRLIGRGSISTDPERGIDDASDRLAKLLNAARSTAPADAEIVGVGVSTAGPIRPATGTYNHPPNLPGWHDKTMKPRLAESMSLPVWVGHDATLAALAETRFGDHVGAENLVYVTISTGVGGGIITNSEMVTGASGGAGEVGHLAIRTGSYRCNVGCDGCFEGNACGPAIARAARDRWTGEGPLADLADGDPDNITSRMVFDAADEGDPIAQEVVDLTVENVGIGLGSLMNIFNPEALVIGGGVVQGLQRHWQKLQETVIERSLPGYGDTIPLTATRLGDDVSLLGAAQLAFRQARRL